MATGATGQLGLALPVQGELSGTWGDTVNNGITQYTNIAIAATLTLTGDGAVTLANTTGDASASNITSTLAGAGTVTAQFAIVRITGTTTTKVITGPSYSKTYLVDNASSFAITFKASGQTGVSIAAGEEAIVFFNGTDYVKAASSVVSALTGTLPVANGGTGQTSYTDGQLLIGNTTGNTLTKATLTQGTGITITNGSGAITIAATADVVGPASSTDNAFARFDSTTGKLLQNSTGATLSDTGAAVFTGALDVLGNSTAGSNIKLYEDTDNGTNYVAFKAPDTIAADVTWTLPAADGTSAQVLSTNGSGTLSWATAGGGSSATPTVEGTVYGRTGSTGYNAALGYNAMATTPVGGDNVAVGAYSLQVNTAADVTAVGSYALNANTSGTANVGVGRLALYANTTGAYNVAVGHSALKANTTADANTAVGYQAAFTSTTATRITAVGMNSLLVNTVNDNTAVGYATLQANTTGANNVAVGCQEASGYPAMYSNTTGSSNTALGAGALSRNTTASENTAVGHQAAYLNTTGAYNTAIGTSALKANTTASKNTAVGYVALTSNTTGANNVAVGDNNFYANTTGSNNTSIGCEAAKGITTGSNHIAFGYRAGQSLTTANNTICIGATSAGSAVTGNGILHIATGGSTASSSSAANEMVICCDTATGKGGTTGFINPGGGGVYQGNNSATWSVTSDQRLKKNIVDNNIGLDKINAIRVRNFEYRLEDEITELPINQAIKKTGVQLGAIAQELQAVLPDCVKTESTGVLSVDSDNLTWYMINAIKELKAENDSLKARLDAANL